MELVQYFQMHFVAFVLVVNVVLALNANGDDTRKWNKRAADDGFHDNRLLQVNEKDAVPTSTTTATINS